jgi:glycosyltransferase involved in cell wall biosynthesis
VRIAWFSPLPPTPSGIAAYSAELVPLLARRGYQIETFTAETGPDFVWKQRRAPYDLTVYQLGNAAWHDYMWAYVFRYPGLVVLHDAQLHQARALALTRRWMPRRDDYVAEFRANHPDAPAEIADLVIAGMGGSLYQLWPMIRLVVDCARLTVVHNHLLKEALHQRYPTARFHHVPMGVRDPLEQPIAESALRGIRGRYGIPPDATIVAAYGGVTPEKRIDVLLRAVAGIADRHPQLHVMLVGPTSEYYDVMNEAGRWGIADRVHVTGYVPDADLPAHLSAADLCACMRWPTNGETSASWLRCLAAGRPTIVTDLEYLGDVPTLDPRGWHQLDISARDASRLPVAVSIELIDELHSLELALDRLAGDPSVRASLGIVARGWWQRHHQLSAMAAAYDRVLQAGVSTPSPACTVPPHLIDDGWRRGRSIGEEMGISHRLGEFGH